MLNKKNLGKFGEKISVQYLKKKNYQVVEKNYRCRAGEIDIIAKKDNIFIFIEVKTRTSILYGEPIESINNIKADKIRKVAEYYLSTACVDEPRVRFDVISVQKAYRKIIISHLKNAF